MLNHLLVANFTSADLSDGLWERLRGTAATVTVLDRDSEDFETALGDADGLILRLGMAADTALFDAAPQLKYIGMYGTGYGRIDTVEASRRKIVVTNVADYSTESVAELTVALALLVRRNLAAELARASTGNVDETDFPGRDLATLSFGIVGAGHIGSRVVRILSAGFGSQVRYWSRQPKPELDELPKVNYAELDEVLDSDVVSLHLAATAGTEGILNARRIQALPNGATLLNTGPNELVDLDAVLTRAASGELTFVMDHADELDASTRARLLATPHTVVLPPIGYATTEADTRKQTILVENVEKYLAGTPSNWVNP